MWVGNRHTGVCRKLSPVGRISIPRLNDGSVVGELIPNVGGENVGGVGEPNLREVGDLLVIHIHRIQGVVCRPLLGVATITSVHNTWVRTTDSKVSSVVDVELKQEPEYKAKKMSKADPPKVADDTPKTKPKRVISPEHLAKMKAAREAKRAASSTPEKEETEKEKSAPKPKPKVAKPKKEEAPPDAPPKSKEESQQEATSAPGPREKKIPVFKMGSP